MREANKKANAEAKLLRRKQRKDREASDTPPTASDPDPDSTEAQQDVAQLPDDPLSSPGAED